MEGKMGLLFIIIIGFIIYKRYYPFYKRYSNSNYGSESGVSFFQFVFDKGNIGEGETFFILESIPVYSRIVTNVYLPTENGTTELDVVFISEMGIYVLESKNYSGWIYGNINHKFWTSVIYKSKHKFYNPIWQNKTHIKALKSVIDEEDIKSIIVFSERCTLKEISVGNHVVINRYDLKSTIEEDLENIVFDKNKVDLYYYKLKVYSNQDDEYKRRHIENIRSKRKYDKRL